MLKVKNKFIIDLNPKGTRATDWTAEKPLRIVKLEGYRAAKGF